MRQRPDDVARARRCWRSVGAQRQTEEGAAAAVSLNGFMFYCCYLLLLW